MWTDDIYHSHQVAPCWTKSVQLLPGPQRRFEIRKNTVESQTLDAYPCPAKWGLQLYWAWERQKGYLSLLNYVKIYEVNSYWFLNSTQTPSKVKVQVQKARRNRGIMRWLQSILTVACGDVGCHRESRTCKLPTCNATLNSTDVIFYGLPGLSSLISLAADGQLHK